MQSCVDEYVYCFQYYLVQIKLLRTFIFKSFCMDVYFYLICPKWLCQLIFQKQCVRVLGSLISIFGQQILFLANIWYDQFLILGVFICNISI